MSTAATKEASGFDGTVGRLVRFATGLRFEDLPQDVVHQAKRRILDTLGCCLGGFDGPPSRIARELAAEETSTHGARVLGLAQRSTPGAAAFANTVMGRYLDFNDGNGSTTMSGAHPSDMTMGILAVADAYRASGKAAILGVLAAYEANAIPVPFMKLGWDQGTQVGLGVAIGSSIVLGLTPQQMSNAISLTVAPNVPLRVTRSGELSEWKGCATAAASRSAIFGTLLAQKGMTGPGQVFEGRHGLRDQVSGVFEVDIDTTRDGYRITTSDIKGYPMAHNMHACVETLLEMTKGIAEADITAIDVQTYAAIYHESGSEPEKWDPKTRETADHSLPYALAYALRNGTVTLAAFSPEKFTDPTLRPLMNKITIAENPELTAAKKFTNLGGTTIEVFTRDGTSKKVETGIVRGHHLNPMTDEELERKFRSMAELVAPKAKVDAVLKALWSLDAAPDMSAVLDAWGALVTAKS